MKLRLLGIFGLALLLSSCGNETNDFNKDSEIINGITIGDILKMKEDYIFQYWGDYNFNKDLSTFDKVRILDYYGNYVVNNNEVAVVSLLIDGYGFPAVETDITLGEVTLTFGSKVPEVYDIDESKFVSLEDAYESSLINDSVVKSIEYILGFNYLN